MISKKKLCFIHIPKTAGTSTVDFCKKALGKKFISGHHVVVFDKPMLYIDRAFRNKIDKKYFNKRKYYTFTIVRNPFDLLVSMYHYGVPYTTFSHFDVFRYINFPFINFKDYFNKFLDPLFPWYCPPQKRSLFFQITNGKKIAPDFILFYENLESNLKNLLKDLYQIKKFPKFIYARKTESKKNYKFYYNKKMIKIFQKKFKNDLDTFGYTFEDCSFKNYQLKKKLINPKRNNYKVKKYLNTNVNLINFNYNEFRNNYRKRFIYKLFKLVKFISTLSLKKILHR